MTWGNPPKLEPTKAKQGKVIQPEDLAKSGTEDGHQAALFCWCAQNTDKYPQLKYMFSVPNGGSRHIAEAIKFVGTGTRAGVPDIFLPYPKAKRNYEYHGLFIEMKVGKNKPTNLQWEWMVALESYGYLTKVCYSWTEARDTLIAYLEGKL
jgi:hypothetical protein